VTASFKQLNLPPAQLENLDRLGYTEMTPIQAKSLPFVMEGRDLIAKAKTGSGKTAAFSLGMLTTLNERFFAVQTLVLCPTRELCTQVANEIRRLAQFKANIKVLVLCGGQSIGPQIGSLEHGAHIVVGTPGRISDHLRKQTLVLDHVSTLVLDEADRMLDMGFFEEIEAIIQQTPTDRQTLLFSATYPDKIQKLSSGFQKDPVEVTVESVHSESRIQQLFYLLGNLQKTEALTRVISHHRLESCLVFCHTKQLCQDVSEYLQSQGYSALALHGDLEQNDRDQVLVQFSNNSSSILVATDVAARGLDIKDLQAVINYDVPKQVDTYIHRIGRTGRAGKEGLAINLIKESEKFKVDNIEKFQGSRPQCKAIGMLDEPTGAVFQPPMTTLCISGGRKHKVRPGDILGALTGEAGIPGNNVGKIDLFDYVAYVAVDSTIADKALERLLNGNIKGRRFRVRKMYGQPEPSVKRDYTSRRKTPIDDDGSSPYKKQARKPSDKGSPWQR